MKNALLLFAIVFSTALLAQDRSIEFKDYTFDEALKASKAENKPIFMDCYAVWCGPCKWMSANIFTQNEVADFYNANFICVKFDMEKGEGLELAKEFQIRAYPTLIFVDANRQLVMKSIGASRENADYIALGENAKSDAYNLVALAENVADNRSNAEYMSKYFKIMSGAGMVDQEEVAIYFNNIPKDQWASESNWQIIIAVVDNINGAVFQDVLNNPKKYEADNGEQVEQFVSYKIQNALRTALYSRNPDAAAQYQALLAEVENWNFEGKAAIIFASESGRLKRQSPEAYMEYCIENVENVLWEDANQLNAVAWYFFENTTDATYLAAAEKWAARAVELDSKSHAILDTYANVLMANGKYNEALAAETKAVALATEQGAETGAYNEVILEIKGKM